ncbi:MAG: hypothetical protein F7C35_08440 [Desulfurococcales archaeon]|nr:hypothetical protein [Desulfurococcales archaeon]
MDAFGGHMMDMGWFGGFWMVFWILLLVVIIVAVVKLLEPSNTGKRELEDLRYEVRRLREEVKRLRAEEAED